NPNETDSKGNYTDAAKSDQQAAQNRAQALGQPIPQFVSPAQQQMLQSQGWTPPPPGSEAAAANPAAQHVASQVGADNVRTASNGDAPSVYGAPGAGNRGSDGTRQPSFLVNTSDTGKASQSMNGYSQELKSNPAVGQMVNSGGPPQSGSTT